jgi:hypothetical protein
MNVPFLLYERRAVVYIHRSDLGKHLIGQCPFVLEQLLLAKIACRARSHLWVRPTPIVTKPGDDVEEDGEGCVEGGAEGAGEDDPEGVAVGRKEKKALVDGGEGEEGGLLVEGVQFGVEASYYPEKKQKSRNKYFSTKTNNKKKGEEEDKERRKALVDEERRVVCGRRCAVRYRSE